RLPWSRTPPEPDWVARGDLVPLMVLVPEPLLREQRERLEARLDALVQPNLERDRLGLDSFGPGLPGLEASTRWYAGFNHKYSGVGRHPRVNAAFEELARRRGGMLAAGEAELAGQIRGANSHAEIRAIVVRYLGVPS